MTDNVIYNNPFNVIGYEFRSFDGTGNNENNFELGSAGAALINIAPLDYGDGFSTPSGANRANPRVISNLVADQTENIPSDRGLTNLIWAFGQFLDHDLDLVPETDEEVSIHVPTGDPDLDPEATGEVEIPLGNSDFIDGTGTDPSNPRQLLNNITAWIDGSNIYGSDDRRAWFLRSFESGKLKVSNGNLLPFNDGSVENDDPRGGDPTRLFVAGDTRSNENSVLVSMHTLFVREHNRIAEELGNAHSEWSDEQIFQRARDINIAQYQSIIYNEYLPSLLGVNALPEYQGYDSDIEVGINRTFASAAFRFGHTQLSSGIPRLDNNGETIEQGDLTLAEVFFRSTDVVQETGIDPIFRGIASSLSQNIDTKVIDDVRNLLFGGGGSVSGRDLFAINIQRARLHGLADYNTIRESFGLDRVTGFADITSDLELQAKLEDIYEGDVNNIDAFVGLLAEDRVPSTAVGETLQAVLVEQFVTLRNGDRFYYENTFSNREIRQIERTTFSDIIRRNTDTTIIQDNAFSLLNEGTNRRDILNGGLGNDSIYGNNGRDRILANAGDDFISGGRGRDTIEGGSGDDNLNGDRGRDRILGNEGDDFISGGRGRDTIEGGSGNDTLNGDRDRDRISGNEGDDFISGGRGRDTIEGGSGDDTLNGGAEIDRLTGGAGADDFVFGETGLDLRHLGLDFIEDFNAEEDRIVVNQATFANLSGNISFGVADGITTPRNSSSTIVYEKSTGLLFYNQNGSAPGLGNGRAFARLNSGLDLTTANFDVV